MTAILGIDPGKYGALALLDSYGELLWVEDMPLAGNQVDAYALADMLFDANMGCGDQCVAVIEDVHSMPRQGVASSFNFGKSFGIVLGVCAAEAVRIEMVSPHRWKKALRLTADKEVARRRAIERWPGARDRFKNKKDADRAEAALIGLWWIEDSVRIKPKESA